MLSFFILCWIGINVAQVPKPCITPPRWEARIFSNNQQQKLNVGARLSYDSTFHRAHLVQEVQAGAEHTTFDIISLFELNVEFLIDLTTEYCTRHPIEQS